MQNMSKITEERNKLKKEAETKNQELQEKVKTITQVKKIGRRYKMQYDELKLEHDKVSARSSVFISNVIELSVQGSSGHGKSHGKVIKVMENS